VQLTQKDELGGYYDTSGVVSSAMTDGVFQKPYQSAPFPTFELDDVLARTYLIGTQTLTTAMAPSTVVATYDFPEVLFAQTFVANKIKGFEYFKAGLRISVRIAATTMLYGSLVMGYTPYASEESYTPTTVAMLTGGPHVVISINSAEVVTMDIPYISPQLWTKTVPATVAEMGRITIMVLNPLTNVTDTTHLAQVNVMAEFLAPKLAMPHGFVPTSNPVMIDKEAEEKSKNHSVGNSLISTQIRPAVVKGLRTVAKTAYTAFKSSMTQEAATIATTLIASCLSKPATLDYTAVGKINPFHDLASGRGIDTSIPLAVDPENGVSTEPNVGGSTCDEMSIQYFAGTPMLYQITELRPTTEAFLFATGHDVAHNTFVDMALCMFAYFSGSMKYQMLAMASKFHKVRFVIWLQKDSVTARDWVDCYHRVYDVQADTMDSFTIPYVSNNMSESYGHKWYLWVKTLSWCSINDVIDAPIYLNFFKAAGPDLQVGCPLDVGFTPNSDPRVDFREPFPMFADGMTYFSHEGFLFGEKIVSFRELLHRYTPFGAVSSDHIAVFDPVAGRNGSIEGLGHFFRFWRGSIRFKILFQKSQLKQRSVMLYKTGFGEVSCLQGTTVSSDTNPVLEFVAPYYYPRLFLSSGSSTNNVYDAYFSQEADEWFFAMKAAGDDFSYYFLRFWPCTLTYGRTGTAYGLNALRNFLVT
jgi:hypothetical protein